MQSSKSIVALRSLVFVVPFLFVWLGDCVFWLVTNRIERFFDEPGILLVRSVLAASPFAFLAWTASQSGHPNRYLLAAAVGVILTAALWGLFYYDDYTYWRDEECGGANIGLGLVMVFSPVIVGLGMGISYWLAKSWRTIHRRVSS